MRMCRHCDQRQANRPKKLCWRCHSNTAIREQYVSLSPFGKRTEIAGSNLLSMFTTTATPGSVEKLEVLCYRAKMGRLLFHPEDAAA